MCRPCPRSYSHPAAASSMSRALPDLRVGTGMPLPIEASTPLAGSQPDITEDRRQRTQAVLLTTASNCSARKAVGQTSGGWDGPRHGPLGQPRLWCRYPITDRDRCRRRKDPRRTAWSAILDQRNNQRNAIFPSLQAEQPIVAPAWSTWLAGPRRITSPGQARYGDARQAGTQPLRGESPVPERGSAAAGKDSAASRPAARRAFQLVLALPKGRTAGGPGGR